MTHSQSISATGADTASEEDIVSLRSIIQRRAELQTEHASRVSAHATWLERYQAEIEELRQSEALCAGGVDLLRLRRGLSLIDVAGSTKPVIGGCPENQRELGARAAVIADAKIDIANGAQRLRDGYFGVKNYAHFGDQRCDCQYHLGPKHGSIVFRIGLPLVVREGLKTKRLSAAEIEDILYVLANLDSIEQAKKGGAA